MIIITVIIIVIHVYLHSGLTAHSQCGAVHLKYHRHEHFATCQLKTVTVRGVAVHLLHEKERWLVDGM